MNMYATLKDLELRMGRELEDSEKVTATALLMDVAALIDAYCCDPCPETARVVSCRAVIRALASGDMESGVPLGASQGSMTALGYNQQWTLPSGAGAGELYLSKSDRRLLGLGNAIGSHSPTEELTKGGIWT